MKFYFSLYIGFICLLQVQAQPGADCNSAVAVANLPFQQTGLSTSDTGDAYDTSPCGDNYLKGNDFLFQYTPTADAYITVELSNVGAWTGLHVLDDCPDGSPTCVASDLSSLSGSRLIENIALAGGQTYYLIVSTFSPPATTDFDIEVREGIPPPPGSTCSDPRIITQLPFQDFGQSTGSYGDDYSGSGPCVSENYWNGDEVIYRYTPSMNQRVDIELTNLSGFFAGAHLLDACIEDNPQCVASAVNAVSTDPLLIEEVLLQANTTYYLVLSTWENPQSIDYDLEIRLIDSCNPPAEFTAFINGPSSIAVNWTDSDEAVFQIELAEGINGSVIQSQETNQPSVEFSNLTPGEFYEVSLQKECLPPSLLITGVYDGPLSGGNPKGIELYVTRDIDDLSLYGLGSANNGEGSDGQEYTFPAMALPAHTTLYWTSDLALFQQFFGFPADFESPVALINGNDAVELFENGILLDLFGDPEVNGTGTVWDYRDGWAYRRNAQNANGGQFDPSNWIFSGLDELEGGPDNASSDTPFPFQTFDPAPNLFSQQIGPLRIFIPPLPPVCDGTFTDSGGSNYDYFENQQDTVTICPDEVGYGVVLDFSSFQTNVENGQCADLLQIFDGPDSSFPPIAPTGTTGWCWDGTSGTGDLTGKQIAASDTSGCLTIYFDSNDSLQAAGWVADVQCMPLQICDAPTAIQVDSVDETLAVLSWINTGITIQQTEISYGIGMFNPAAGTMVQTTENEIVLSNLESNETYTYFVRNVCGAFGQGDWLGPFSFETACILLPGNDLAGAIELDDLPMTITGNTLNCYTNTFGESGPEIFYRLTTDSCTYQLEISTCNVVTTFDTYLYLLDANGNTIASNDDDLDCDFEINGQSRLSTIDVIVEPLTEYVIALEGFGNFSGDFRLDIQPNTRIAFEANPQFTPPSCQGVADGSITLNVSGGKPPYQFIWNTGEQSESIEDLPAGTYSITIADACGFNLEETFELQAPDSIGIEMELQHPSTDISKDGSIQVAATGGTPPYSYAWGNGSNIPFLNGLGEGLYCIQITDAEGCQNDFCFQLVGEITSTEMPADIEHFQVFPSPADVLAFIEVDFRSSKSAKLEVFNFTGKNMYTTSLSQTFQIRTSVNVTQWPAGMYFIKISWEEGEWIHTFIRG